ncbi:hypothetical protein OF83DRAFT_1173828 [Amylostereum chailletii]|nr:hypothetical protein OF83DRAFT_1173828 [Amylostereum chailletii]
MRTQELTHRSERAATAQSAIPKQSEWDFATGNYPPPIQAPPSVSYGSAKSSVPANQFTADLDGGSSWEGRDEAREALAKRYRESVKSLSHSYMTSRQPYDGLERRLVIAFDLGTTFSGVSYAVLDPGRVPEIRSVARYPGQDAGNSKVQTIIYYDSNGNVLAVGAEEPPLDEDEDGDEDALTVVEPLKVEWFKLLLRPKAATSDVNIPTATLPSSKDIISVFADFYRYLFDRARASICETNVNGDSLWNSVQGNIDFVLSHPNGWEGAQQGAMRKAAIMAGLVPDTPSGIDRITFVTEGEASCHYCISMGLMADATEVGKNVMIIDAGGGTVDLSTYTFTQNSPVKIAEIAESGCIFQGSVIVRQRAHAFVKDKLKSSRFGEKRCVDSICEVFDQTTKKRFKGDAGATVKFSNMISDRDVSVDIRNGQIKFSKVELCSFFDPSVAEIIRSIDDQIKATVSKKVTTFCLVGGFAASEYIFQKLKEHLDTNGLCLFRPEEHTGKSVAEGAVSFHIDNYVSARVEVTYGVEGAEKYDEAKTSHKQRENDAYPDYDGELYIRGAFIPIILKGSQVPANEEFEQELIQSYSKKKGIARITSEIICYRGDDVPEFTDEPGKTFSTLCTISADISSAPMLQIKGPIGTYHERHYSIVMSLGLTELKAHVAWKVNGIKQTGPASVVYDDDFDLVVTVAD